MNRANVTVVVPVHDASATIERCLGSLAAQRVAPAAVVVVDDDSSPAEQRLLDDVLAETPLAVDLVRLPRNVGPGAARNRGWERVRTRWVAFCDADDAWSPDKLALEQPVLTAADPDVAVLSSRWGEGLGDARPWAISNQAVPRPISRRELLTHNPCPTSTVTVRADVGPSFGEGFLCEDYYAWLALARHGRLLRLEHELASRYKAAYGAGGLSAQMRRMARDEYRMFAAAGRAGLLSAPELAYARAMLSARLARRFATAALRHG